MLLDANANPNEPDEVWKRETDGIDAIDTMLARLFEMQRREGERERERERERESDAVEVFGNRDRWVGCVESAR